MKKFMLMLALAVSAQWAAAQDNSEKNLVKTLDPKGATSIAFDCKQKEVKADVWDGGLMRVELVVKANMPATVLDQLVKAGRYNIDGALNGDGEFIVSAPNVGKAVVVRGTDLVEEIIVTVQTPTKFIVASNKLEKETPIVAARTLSDIEKIKEMKKITEKVEAAVKVESTLKTQPKFELKEGDILVGGVAIPIWK